MKILLTGASGFVGRHVLQELQKNRRYEVHALSRSAQKDHGNICWHVCDLFADQQVTSVLKSVKPEKMIHLAWETEPGQYWTSEKNKDWFEASCFLLKNFVENGGKRFVGAGTCAEYLWSNDVLDEKETPLKPESLYGVAKRDFFCHLKNFSSENNLSYAWGRLFFCYGPGERQERLIPSMVKTFFRKQIFDCRTPNVERDFLHVSDIARAFCFVLDSDLTGAFNICSNQNMKIKEIVRQCAAYCEAQNLVKIKNDSIDKMDRVVGNNQVLKRIGWTPKVSLEDGLKEYIEKLKHEI